VPAAVPCPGSGTGEAVTDAARILLILLLVLGNALFVAAEFALVTARRGRLEVRAEEGYRPARTAVALMNDPVRFISTIQVGVTVFAILIGALGEPLLSEYFSPLVSRGVAFGLSFLILTYLTVVLGELVPKAISLQKAETTAMVLAYPLDLLARVMYPVVWVLQKSAAAVTRLVGIAPQPAGRVVYTREDVRRTVAEAEDAGALEPVEEEMIYNVFDFAAREARSVMVPRPEVVAVSVDLPPEECLAAVVDSPYTRYPAYRDSLDDVVGVLHVRDLFSALNDRGIANVSIEELLRPPYVVPETKDLGALLADFRRTKQHMAIVVDEYGGMHGIVTLEDVLEELVGEIEDEFDLPDESVERIDETTIRVDGTFPIDDFNEQFRTTLPMEDFHTLAGFVFGKLGRAPVEGDELEHDGLHFLVVQVEGSRIEQLQVEFRGDGTPEAKRAEGHRAAG
jgi:putative hemolysin